MVNERGFLHSLLIAALRFSLSCSPFAVFLCRRAHRSVNQWINELCISSFTDSVLFYPYSYLSVDLSLVYLSIYWFPSYLSACYGVFYRFRHGAALCGFFGSSLRFPLLPPGLHTDKPGPVDFGYPLAGLSWGICRSLVG